MAAKEALTDVTEGWHLGTDSTALVGFWGVTPVAQPAMSAFPAVATTAAVSTGHYGFTAAQANAIIALVNGLRALNVTTGLGST